MKLMVVDDSNIIRGKITRALQVEGVALAGTAADGRAAVTLFARERPELVTMDITMPEMDGIECIRRILQIRRDTLILVISALADKATAIQALKEGAHGFLCKPFSDAELNDALAELIRGARTQAQRHGAGNAQRAPGITAAKAAHSG
jgi:two-component system chemotaxis response regulator CheY